MLGCRFVAVEVLFELFQFQVKFRVADRLSSNEAESLHDVYLL